MKLPLQKEKYPLFLNLFLYLLVLNGLQLKIVHVPKKLVFWWHKRTLWGLCGCFYTSPPPLRSLEAPAAGRLVSRTNVEPECTLTSAGVWPTCPPAGVPSAASQHSPNGCSRYTCLLNKQGPYSGVLVEERTRAGGCLGQ